MDLTNHLSSEQVGALKDFFKAKLSSCRFRFALSISCWRAFSCRILGRYLPLFIFAIHSISFTLKDFHPLTHIYSTISVKSQDICGADTAVRTSVRQRVA